MGDSKGWSMHEDVAVIAINMGAVRKTSMSAWTPFVTVSLGEHAVVTAEYRDGTAEVFVTYSDPPGKGSARPIRFWVGRYSEEAPHIVSFNEGLDQLKEIRASYPEGWAEFLERLAEAYPFVAVLES